MDFEVLYDVFTLPETNMETQKGPCKDYSSFKKGLHGFPCSFGGVYGFSYYPHRTISILINLNQPQNELYRGEPWGRNCRGGLLGK